MTSRWLTTEPRDLLEVGTRSTVVTSQFEPGDWHDYLTDPTLADASRPAQRRSAHDDAE
jgi:hypothetical protein